MCLIKILSFPEGEIQTTIIYVSVYLIMKLTTLRSILDSF